MFVLMKTCPNGAHSPATRIGGRGTFVRWSRPWFGRQSTRPAILDTALRVVSELEFYASIRGASEIKAR